MLKVNFLLKSTTLMLAMAFAFSVYASNGNPPTVNIVSPSAGYMGYGPTVALIAANASDSDGTIAEVRFYVGNTLIGTDSTYPYRIGTVLNSGRHVIRATAYDNDGHVGHHIITVILGTTIESPSSDGGPQILTFP